MKRILGVLAIAAAVTAAYVVTFGAIAHAAPDVDPWRKIYEQRQHVVPQKFDTEAQARFIDAGTLTVSGEMRGAALDAGVARFNGEETHLGPFRCGATTLCGSIALTSASPSTATVTVPAGVSCACWPVGTTAAIAAGGCAASVTSTTLTLTGPNTVTTTMRYFCFL